MSTLISVNYVEPNPSTYNGIVVEIDGELQITKTFNHGKSPNNDFAKAIVFVKEQTGNTSVIMKSSVDHFIMDGGEIPLLTDNE